MNRTLELIASVATCAAISTQIAPGGSADTETRADENLQQVRAPGVQFEVPEDVRPAKIETSAEGTTIAFRGRGYAARVICSEIFSDVGMIEMRQSMMAAYGGIISSERVDIDLGDDRFASCIRSSFMKHDGSQFAEHAGPWANWMCPLTGNFSESGNCIVNYSSKRVDGRPRVLELLFKTVELE